MASRVVTVAFACCALFGWTGGANAQSPAPVKGPADYFPTEVGRQWTYELRITAGKTTQSIIYTTRVIAHQELPDVGVCAVFQSSSGAKLLAMDWYQATRDKLKNPKRQRGKRVVTFAERVLLDRAALSGLPQLPALVGGKAPEKTAEPARKTAAPVGKTVVKTAAKTPAKTGSPTKTARKTTPAKTDDKTPQPRPTPTATPSPAPKTVARSWGWRAAGSLRASGKIRMVGLQKVRLRYYGALDCVVIEDTGTFVVEGQTRTQWRRLWFAPQIGIVREVSEIRAGATVTFATEAHLMRHE